MIQNDPRPIAALLAALFLMSSLPGCLALAVGAGAGAGATWYLSAARAEVDADPRSVIATGARVLQEMDIRVTRRSASELDGQLQGRTARDERVEIVVTMSPSRKSEVRVRVGLIDDDAAKLILERILAGL